jgi:hypothetical protein
MPTYTELPPATSFPPPPSSNWPTLVTPTIYLPAVKSGARLIKIPPILKAPGIPKSNPGYHLLGCYLFSGTRINDTLKFYLEDTTTSAISLFHTRLMDSPALQACIDHRGGIYYMEVSTSDLEAKVGTYNLSFTHSNAAGKVVGVSIPKAYQVT